MMSEIISNKDIKSEVKKSPDSPSQVGIGVFSRFFSFGTRSGNNTPEQNSPKTPTATPNQVFYGVYIPLESKGAHDEDSSDFKTLHVYTDRVEALKIVKKYKKARFKALNNRQDAVAFALRGAEPDREVYHIVGDGSLGLDAEGALNISQSSVGEKASQFRAPRPQEMVQLRKLIEGGDLNSVRGLVWENPRYLVSSGDTPSILQEGSRYNALHSAVKTNNLEMCDLLLSTISDPQFMQLLFADDNVDNNKERAAVLLDLYLNMPDKAMNETPLHFAVKFGFKEVVDLLVSYPQCCRQVTNKFGDQPKDVICSRAKVSSPSLVSEISSMLRDRFYVPVLHSEDGSHQPVIGEPFSPATPPVCDRSLPRDPMSPRVEIRALAGPMEKSEAESFRRRWKTPPRSSRLGPLAEPKFRLQDVGKGLEKIGRDLAQKMNIGWKEYWPFLDTFTDLVSDEGLGLLEDYLKNKYVSQWNNSSNSVIVPDSFQLTPRTPVQLNFHRPKHNSSLRKFRQNKKTSESEDSVLSPISGLCVALKHCNLNDESKIYKYEHKETKYQTKINECEKVENCTNIFFNPGLNPYLCVERSCLVFAKRITVGLVRALTVEIDMIGDYLRSEMKHLQQTVVSYMEDPRFSTVDFHLIHSRVAQLIANKLHSEVTDNDDMDALIDALRDLFALHEKSLDISNSSDEEESIAYRIEITSNHTTQNGKKIINSHVRCFSRNLRDWLLENKSKESMKSVESEEECIQLWGELYKCCCLRRIEWHSRNRRKNSSYTKRMENANLSSSPKSGLDIVSRRLKFDSDEKGLNEILSLSSPKGDKNQNICHLMSSSPDTKIKLDVKKCLVNSCETEALSEDEYDSENEEFHTPVSSGTPRSLSSDDSEYEEANDGSKVLNETSSVDVFIQGDHPTKMDKAVYEAIYTCEIDRGRYPYVYRWRHNIGLYPSSQRESWPDKVLTIGEESSDEECLTPVQATLHLGNINTNKLTMHTSTPTKQSQAATLPSTPPVQVSKWMRVTGPNTPRSAINNKNFRPNVSFGF